MALGIKVGLFVGVLEGALLGFRVGAVEGYSDVGKGEAVADKLDGETAKDGLGDIEGVFDGVALGNTDG